jgi:hypothetical protein
MASLRKVNFVNACVQNLDLLSVPVIEAASQSFKRGDLLTLSSGKVQAAIAANSSEGSGYAPTTGIAYIALEDATGTTNTKLLAALIRPDMIFKLPVLHSTPASAITAYAQVGTAYGIWHYSDGGSPAFTTWGLAYEDTTHTVGRVVSIYANDPLNPVGEQYGYVGFQFDPDSLAFFA